MGAACRWRKGSAASMSLVTGEPGSMSARILLKGAEAYVGLNSTQRDHAPRLFSDQFPQTGKLSSHALSVPLSPDSTRKRMYFAIHPTAFAIFLEKDRLCVGVCVLGSAHMQFFCMYAEGAGALFFRNAKSAFRLVTQYALRSLRAVVLCDAFFACRCTACSDRTRLRSERRRNQSLRPWLRKNRFAISHEVLLETCKNRAAVRFKQHFASSCAHRLRLSCKSIKAVKVPSPCSIISMQSIPFIKKSKSRVHSELRRHSQSASRNI